MPVSGNLVSREEFDQRNHKFSPNVFGQAFVLLSGSMSVLRSDTPLSSFQRRANKLILPILAFVGIALGLKSARECAAVSSAYLADYDYAIALYVSLAVVSLGLILLIYWRTRWVGSGLIAAGVLSYVVFLGAMAFLLKTDRVAWLHEKMISFGPDHKASLVIHFRYGVNAAEVEEFESSVLQVPSTRHEGRDFPPFVQSYFRLAPIQANGHEGIALNFFDNAPSQEVNAYLAAIKNDKRVDSVYLDTSPNSIHDAVPPH